jgi:hemoglobin
MKDIEGRADIDVLVDTFYAKVRKDKVIGPFFNDVAKVNWEEHLPHLKDFWEAGLFHSVGFKGNIIRTHQELNSKSAMQKEHFEHWVDLFSATVDELFQGPNAEAAKQKAWSMSVVIQMKLQ